MNSKHPPIRGLGQKSIPSTFLFRCSNPHPSNDCKEDAKIKGPNKDSRVSLSDFLNRKLHRSSVLPTSIQGKDRPFLSPVGGSEVRGSNGGLNEVKKRGDTEVKSGLDVVLEQFKCTRKENEDALGSCDGSESGSSTIDLQEARKRKRPFGGGNGKQAARKHLVVLGDDQPKPIHQTPEQKGKEQSFIASKKPRRQYNHYANGCGWWDCDMEGVDNEEVGCNEVWEGVGSATLGGLDWN
ncbi:uncharacterized protein LOC130782561 [Actinidia eriantha]|uniref:uncharacterized protein LOC130782561 n=1 Tax=Actinidia eriantha TaxID=165200 RepID=UPI00258E29B7|nr:uncharacterized protein LOC130782561 [Actinidia eriantha]